MNLNIRGTSNKHYEDINDPTTVTLLIGSHTGCGKLVVIPPTFVFNFRKSAEAWKPPSIIYNNEYEQDIAFAENKIILQRNK